MAFDDGFFGWRFRLAFLFRGVDTRMPGAGDFTGHFGWWRKVKSDVGRIESYWWRKVGAGVGGVERL